MPIPPTSPLASLRRSVRPERIRTARLVVAALALFVAALLPATVLVATAVAALVLALVAILVSEARRDPFRLREHRRDDPEDLLSARLVGFRR